MMRLQRLTPYKNVRELIVTARLEAGYTQSQLAVKLGCSQSMVSKIENGERNLDLVEFLGICSILKIDPTQTIEQLYASVSGVSLPFTNLKF